MNTETKLRVSDLMTANVRTVAENDMLYDAIRMMEVESLSALPVVDSTGKLCGILSNSDLLQLAYNLQCDVSTLSAVPDHIRKILTDVLADDNCETKVCGAMTPTVETIGPTETMVDAAKSLINKNVHHLPVVDSNGKSIGIVSTLDIVRGVAFKSDT